jgi:hypothetical protein
MEKIGGLSIHTTGVGKPFWSSVNFHPFGLTVNGSWAAFRGNGNSLHPEPLLIAYAIRRYPSAIHRQGSLTKTTLELINFTLERGSFQTL